eukprot:gnl/TRDRNA2_/TRDRNA2_163548_c3_seq1.p1 gnl/TRDRNA2_/TRDRNA2_163548_c3~~gnl/TRDRNA2_/TRDRNA2_163548_c3_seq1.p1  ORF type:complete len:125 (-),score=26.82 gnl/TRDRNA2_/TRDRNA2_163548_c3_seq1:266-640(-)
MAAVLGVAGAGILLPVWLQLRRRHQEWRVEQELQAAQEALDADVSAVHSLVEEFGSQDNLNFAPSSRNSGYMSFEIDDSETSWAKEAAQKRADTFKVEFGSIGFSFRKDVIPRSLLEHFRCESS